MSVFTLHHGDCIEVMRGLLDGSVDAVVTDPPYGIRFMGKAWDGADIDKRLAYRRAQESHSPDAGPNGGHKSAAAEAGKYDLAPAAMRAFQEFSQEWASEAFRVLKPGGHLLSFSSARTYHRMTSGIEDAGFEIRDQIMWIYGSGFPKSHNLDGEHAGMGTALKPAHEPICVARKPLIGTVAANVRMHGTGALNIDGCRIGTDETLRAGAGGTWAALHRGEGRPGEESASRTYADAGGTNFSMMPGQRGGDPAGRWPANLIHDGSDVVLAGFPDAKGQQGRVTGGEPTANGFSGSVAFGGMISRIASADPRIEVETSAARFFYCAKTSKADRNAGLDDFTPARTSDGRAVAADNAYQRGKTVRSNTHPTVKPTDLMAYLCRLVTPPGGIVLDPFMGSGSTGKACMREGFRFIGIEMSEEYMVIARARIEHALAAASHVEPASPQLDIFESAVA